MKKNKIISLGILIVFFLTLVNPKTVYSYESNSTIYFKEKSNIPINKVWTINFNSNVIKDSGNLSKINVYDENNNLINTTKNASTDNTVVVQAVGNYEYNKKYSIVIEKGFLSQNGKELKNNVQMYFNTASPVVNTNKIIDVKDESLNLNANLTASINKMQYDTYTLSELYKEAAVLTSKIYSADPAKTDYNTWYKSTNKALILWREIEKRSGNLYDLSNDTVNSIETLKVSTNNRYLSGAYDDVTVERINAIFDSAPAGKKIKTLATYLGVDARRAFAMLKMSQEELAKTWNDRADTMHTLEKAATVIKDGSKVAIFVGGAIVTGGIASGTMTLTEVGTAVAANFSKAAVGKIIKEGGVTLVASGVDLLLEVTGDGATIALGEDNKITKMVTSARKVTEPAAAILGIYNIKNAANGVDNLCNSFMLTDINRGQIQDKVLVGVKLTDVKNALDDLMEPNKKIVVSNITNISADKQATALEDWFEEDIEDLDDGLDELGDLDDELDELFEDWDEELDLEDTLYDEDDLDFQEDEDIEEEEDGLSFDVFLTGGQNNYNLAVNVNDVKETGAIMSISLVSGQGAIGGLTTATLSQNGSVSWYVTQFSPTEDLVLKIKRAETGEEKIVTIGGNNSSSNNNQFNDNEIPDISYFNGDNSELVSFEGNDLNGYWVYKYEKDSHKIVGPVYIYSDATKSYLKEVYYFTNNSNNMRYIKYYEDGSLRATGTLLGDMSLLSNQIYVDHTTIFEAATTTNNNIYGSQLPKLPRIGVNKSYYTNGNINAVTNYSNGEFNGQYLKYYENGLLQIEGNYQNGSESGLWKYYYYTPQGEIEDISETRY